MITFTMTMRVEDYVLVEDKFERVTARKKFTCNNYDDLSNLFLTLVEAGDSTLSIDVDKKEVE